VSWAVLDDHLLRDLLADDIPDGLQRVLADHEPATTNLYLYRLCRSAVSAPGGALTGSWDADKRRALGARLVTVPLTIEILPIRTIAFRMAELADSHRLSTLGAEAVAAAEKLLAPLCVWSGDDGPAIRSAMTSLSGDYRPIPR
jgi:hypothetical protein